MKQPKYKSQKVGRTPNPGFDVDISEILLPFDEIDQMSDMFDLSMDNFIDIQRNSDTDHGYNADVSS